MNTCLHCQQPLRGSYCRNQACRELALQRLNEQLRARQYGFDRPPAPFLVTSRDTLPQILDQIRDHWAALTRHTPPEVVRRLTVLREEFDAFARDFTVASHAAGYARFPRALRAWVVATQDLVCRPLTSGYRFELYETLLAWAEGSFIGENYVPHAGFFGELPVELRLSAADKRYLTQDLNGTQVLFRLPADLELPPSERWHGLAGALCLGECIRFLGSDTSRSIYALDTHTSRWDHDLRQPMRIGLPSQAQPGTFTMEYDTWSIPVSWIEEASEWHTRYWGPVDWTNLETARAGLYTPLPASRFASEIVHEERS